jgi:hypothetical protein
MKYRVSRKNFLYVLNLIRNDPVFARKGNKKQIPVEYQLKEGMD